MRRSLQLALTLCLGVVFAVPNAHATFYGKPGRILISTNVERGAGPDYDLFTLRTDGTQVRNLTPRPGFQIEGSWSPDGRRIAYGDYGTESRLMVMDVRGKRVSTLVSGRFQGGRTEQPNRPSWSPDGT
ncbi:MAG: hypothetical protein M3238_06455, partial [Actinomycetota bacterium]|nr:hypothetical protein [Actinomycetota bacterium]